MLSSFCTLSSQKVSKEKSSILFSKNTLREDKDFVCSSLNILERKKFDRYLGFPLKFANRGSKDFDIIIHKVQDKLNGWQASLLSLEGRRTLINPYLALSLIMSCKVPCSLARYVRKLIKLTEIFYRAPPLKKERCTWSIETQLLSQKTKVVWASKNQNHRIYIAAKGLNGLNLPTLVSWI